MEASLLDLILDEATLLLTDIAQHFAQHPLERVVLHCTPLWFSWRRDSRETVVADVEGSAKHVATLAGGIAIAALQAGYIVLSPKHT